jgi:hypothetical protein
MDAIKSIVRSAILAYANSDLNDFNSKFKMSKLLRDIDDSEEAIQFSDAVVTITKKLQPVIGVSRNYVMEFGTSISNEDSQHKIFSTPAFREYDVDGVLRQCFFEEIPGESSGIDSISVVSSTSSYEVTDALKPEVIIDGDGVNAVASAVVVNGRLVSIKIDNPGSFYNTAKAYIVYDGEIDTTAVLSVSIQKRYGTLRTYYFDNNSIKHYMNINAGEVDYVLGKITLTGFNPFSIDDPFKVLKFTAKPVSSNFESSRSRILTIDETDESSISVTVKTV